MVRKSKDFIDAWIQSVNWKVGNFNLLPIVFGATMALIDIVMMSVVKMTSTGAFTTAVGLPLSMALYALEPFVFLKAMSYEGMVVTNLVWNMMSDVIVTLQGVLVFGESIKGLRWVGIGMSLVALTILAYTEE
jgi:multidrug transporter EmrE-like cation transporter